MAIQDDELWRRVNEALVQRAGWHTEHDDVEGREEALRYINEPPVPSSNPIIRRLQKDFEWGPIANLTSPEAAVEWVRSRASIDRSRPSVKNLFRLRTDR